MLPLNYDIRSYYRKHQTGEETEDGIVTPTYSVDGPFSIAFRPGSMSRELTEQGLSDGSTLFFCIADGVRCFEPKDILTDGENDLYAVISVKTWPTEQTFYVRPVDDR